jgi:hypothetical protein
MESAHFGSAHHDEDEAHGTGQGDEDLCDRECATLVARVVDNLLFHRAMAVAREVVFSSSRPLHENFDRVSELPVGRDVAYEKDLVPVTFIRTFVA